MSRRKLIAILIGVVVLSAAAGYGAASRVRSPAQIAADTAAPLASPILVPAEERVLSTTVVTRGTARFGSPQQITLAPSALKLQAGRVTSIPIAGSQLTEGDVALIASGRPVFLLEGAQLTFRDLGPGLEGEDVLQLEAALVRLGFEPGPVDGVYDELTEAAVAAWYQSAGYTAIEATEEQLSAIAALELELTSARLDILGAEDAVAAAEVELAAAQGARVTAWTEAGAGPAQIATAQAQAAADNQVASADVGAKQATLDGMRAGTSAATRAEIAAAEAELDSAIANEELTRLSGANTIAEAQRAADGAPAAVAAARAEASANDFAVAAEVTGKQVALAALLSDPDAKPADIAVAEQDVTTAIASAAATGLAGQAAVADAKAIRAGAGPALASAQAEADLANQAAAADTSVKRIALDALRAGSVPTASELAAAEAELAAATATAEATRLGGLKAVAEATVAAAATDAALPTTEAALRAAETTLEGANEALRARQELAGLTAGTLGLVQRRAGVQVPADEIVFVPSVPVRVSSVAVARGDEAAGPVMSVTDSVVAIDGSLALSVANLVEAGMPVVIDEPDLGISATGLVTRVAEGPGTNGVDGFHIYFEVLVDGSPPGIVGASVRLTVPIESTTGSVLVVPISALSLAADGSSRVQRAANGVLEFVTVEPGLSAEGFVEVTPVEGVLEAGDLVVIGFDQRGAGS